MSGQQIRRPLPQFVPHSSHEEGKTSLHRATQGSTRVGQEAEGVKGKTGAGTLMVVSMGKVR